MAIITGKFGTTTVFCPVNQTLCSGANLDCYRTCLRIDEERNRRRSERIKSEQEFHDDEREDFTRQMNAWGGGPCPRCQAEVKAENMKAHRNWHWYNDSNLR